MLVGIKGLLYLLSKRRILNSSEIRAKGPEERYGNMLTFLKCLETMNNEYKFSLDSSLASCSVCQSYLNQLAVYLP